MNKQIPIPQVNLIIFKIIKQSTDPKGLLSAFIHRVQNFKSNQAFIALSEIFEINKNKVIILSFEMRTLKQGEIGGGYYQG